MQFVSCACHSPFTFILFVNMNLTILSFIIFYFQGTFEVLSHNLFYIEYTKVYNLLFMGNYGVLS